MKDKIKNIELEERLQAIKDMVKLIRHHTLHNTQGAVAKLAKVSNGYLGVVIKTANTQNLSDRKIKNIDDIYNHLAGHIKAFNIESLTQELQKHNHILKAMQEYRPVKIEPEVKTIEHKVTQALNTHYDVLTIGYHQNKYHIQVDKVEVKNEYWEKEVIMMYSSKIWSPFKVPYTGFIKTVDLDCGFIELQEAQDKIISQLDKKMLHIINIPHKKDNIIRGAYISIGRRLYGSPTLWIPRQLRPTEDEQRYSETHQFNSLKELYNILGIFTDQKEFYTHMTKEGHGNVIMV